jgi:hypothetical protein
MIMEQKCNWLLKECGFFSISFSIYVFFSCFLLPAPAKMPSPFDIAALRVLLESEVVQKGIEKQLLVL